MNRRVFTLAAGLALALAPAALAADEGFRPLFNGKDLTGWVTPDDKGLFTVEDGEIVGRSKAGQLKKNEFLVTDKPYGDFILKAKLKLRNHNSGIQFRSKRTDNGAVSGPQADAADGYWGAIYDEKGTRGIIEQYDKEKARSLIHKGDWNDFEIMAKGDHIIIFLNGTKVIDRVNPKFEKSGVIAFQLHAGPAMEVRIKDVEIKPLGE